MSRLLSLSFVLFSVVAAGCGGSDNGDSSNFTPVATGNIYYVDADGDGYGSMLIAGVSAATAPAGYVSNKLDCADGDSRAHPGQTAFFTTPITGATYLPLPYDFNCDGVETPEYPTAIAGACWTASPCSSGGSNVWDGSVPQCGNVGSWLLQCRLVGSSCTPVTNSRTQACN